jgi:hypothetical protein
MQLTKLAIFIAVSVALVSAVPVQVGANGAATAEAASGNAAGGSYGVNSNTYSPVEEPPTDVRGDTTTTNDSPVSIIGRPDVR